MTHLVDVADLVAWLVESDSREAAWAQATSATPTCATGVRHDTLLNTSSSSTSGRREPSVKCVWVID
jgi:hypothetical protein